MITKKLIKRIQYEVIDKLIIHQTLAIILFQMYKIELQKIDNEDARDICQKIDKFTAQTVGGDELYKEMANALKEIK